MTTMHNPSQPSGGMPPPTGILPLNPALSPQQSLRVVSIRANLLPEQIIAGRQAKQFRTLLVFALVIVLAVLSGWYAFAAHERSQAAADLEVITQQVTTTRARTRIPEYTEVTKAITETEAITTALQAATAADLPWSKVVVALSHTGVRGIRLDNFNGNLGDSSTAGKAATAAPAPAAPVPAAGAPAAGATPDQPVADLTIMGHGPDKKTIAAYLDALAKIKGIAKIDLTSAAKEGTNSWTFSIKMIITAELLCGRFSRTTCKTGGK